MEDRTHEDDDDLAGWQLSLTIWHAWNCIQQQKTHHCTSLWTHLGHNEMGNKTCEKFRSSSKALSTNHIRGKTGYFISTNIYVRKPTTFHESADHIFALKKREMAYFDWYKPSPGTCKCPHRALKTECLTSIIQHFFPLRAVKTQESIKV